MALSQSKSDFTFASTTVRGNSALPELSKISPSHLEARKTIHKRDIFKHRKTPPLHFSVGGRFSSWPAYASAQAILQNRKPCSTTDKTGARDKLGLMVSKPQYLEQLENYLRKELLLLDLTKENAQELKLQPYREIFEFFIEDFKTYKPLLSSIKNAYEVTLAHFREKIRSLEPLKAMLINVSENCNEKILALRAEERYEIKMLRKEKINLLKLIDKKNEEKVSLQTQVTKLRKNLAEQYLHFLNERDARRILVADLNELRYQREDMSLAQSPDVWGEDPVKLTLALKMARQDLTNTQKELNTMKANFGDVVPRRDFEMQEKRNKALYEMLEGLKTDFEEIRKEYETLLQVHMATVKDRDEFFNELQEIQRTSTPRPDWSKCKDVIAGGQDRWRSLAAGKSSNQLVGVLLEEIGSGLLREVETFEGMGTSEEIPEFLRFEGFAQNKKLSRREVVEIIKDVWKERMAEEKQKEEKSTLSQFFLNYLKNRFGEASAMDWSYTIFENIRLFHSVEVMKQFYEVLSGKVEEGVYISQKELVAYLLKELNNSDIHNDGNLTMDQFSAALKNAWPLKTEEQIQELVDTAKLEDFPEDIIQYRVLFVEDELGTPGLFIKKMWEQAQIEKQAYLQDLEVELGPNMLAELGPDQLRQALIAIDPSLDEQTLDSYVSQAFQIPITELEPDIVEEQRVLLAHLRAGAIKRMGPREHETGS
ncbi:translin-associated factor X-interacting protein 1 isoform X1 [Monodelphis domestica]|uniref:Translin associated factor X interacting protein 1 n=3 Tax=Monodelphis domestica TaxID=13616 RepID=F7E536_MONDO|nr:translin-associated factor X-interacting protein 1 isoform X1 [Monodelphis domestica]